MDAGTLFREGGNESHGYPRVNYQIDVRPQLASTPFQPTSPTTPMFPTGFVRLNADTTPTAVATRQLPPSLPFLMLL